MTQAKIEVALEDFTDELCDEALDREEARSCPAGGWTCS